MPETALERNQAARRPYPTFGEALRVWARVAALSFGGPAGQIAVMHRIVVDELRWIGERRFLHALNYCMLLPGPEAQQLAVYIGWLMHGTKGGLAAGILFVLPGALAILALSYVYVLLGDTPLVEGLFFGIKAAVLAVVLQAVVRIGSRALKNKAMIGIAVVRLHCLVPVRPALSADHPAGRYCRLSRQPLRLAAISTINWARQRHGRRLG